MSAPTLEELLILNFQGPWDQGTDYVEDDAVVYNDLLYIARSSNKGVLPSNMNYWTQFTSRPFILALQQGLQGVQGQPGQDGNPGQDNTTPGQDGANGSNGTNGANGIGLNWRGVWSGSSLYVAYDVSRYNTSAYICTQAVSPTANALVELVQGNNLTANGSVTLGNAVGPITGTTAPTFSGGYLTSATSSGSVVGATAWAVELWIKKTSTTDVGYYSQGTSSTNFRLYSDSGSNGGYDEIWVNNFHTALNLGPFGGGINHWYHFMASIEADGHVWFYLNGQWVARLNPPFGINSGAVAGLIEIGLGTSIANMIGNLAQLSVYTHALVNDFSNVTSTAAIHYAARGSLSSYQSAVLADSPSLYYPLNGGAGGTPVPSSDPTHWDLMAQGV